MNVIKLYVVFENSYLIIDINCYSVKYIGLI